MSKRDSIIHVFSALFVNSHFIQYMTIKPLTWMSPIIANSYECAKAYIPCFKIKDRGTKMMMIFSFSRKYLWRIRLRQQAVLLGNGKWEECDAKSGIHNRSKILWLKINRQCMSGEMDSFLVCSCIILLFRPDQTLRIAFRSCLFKAIREMFKKTNQHLFT